MSISIYFSGQFKYPDVMCVVKRKCSFCYRPGFTHRAQSSSMRLTRCAHRGGQIQSTKLHGASRLSCWYRWMASIPAGDYTKAPVGVGAIAISQATGEAPKWNSLLLSMPLKGLLQNFYFHILSIMFWFPTVSLPTYFLTLCIKDSCLLINTPLIQAHSQLVSIYLWHCLNSHYGALKRNCSPFSELQQWRQNYNGSGRH